MLEIEEELKSFLIKVKEESEKAGLKLNIQNRKIMTSSPITSWQIEGGKVETVTDIIFLVSKSLQHDFYLIGMTMSWVALHSGQVSIDDGG